MKPNAAGTAAANENDPKWWQEQNGRLRAETDAANKECNALAAECRALRAQNQNLATACDKAEQTAKVADERAAMLKAERERSQADLRTVSDNCTELARQLAETKAKAKARRVALFEADATLAKLRQRIAELVTDDGGE